MFINCEYSLKVIYYANTFYQNLWQPCSTLISQLLTVLSKYKRPQETFVAACKIAENIEVEDLEYTINH